MSSNLVLRSELPGSQHVLEQSPVDSHLNPPSAAPTTVHWKERAIQFLDGKKVRLNEVLPNWIIQNKADELGCYIKK